MGKRLAAALRSLSPRLELECCPYCSLGLIDGYPPAETHLSRCRHTAVRELDASRVQIEVLVRWTDG